MPNWLASELCMVVSFALGAWKTFKVLKHGGTDYNLLKTWCLLGLLRFFEGYLEFLVSWIPFYWLSKCVGLGLLFLPDGNVPTVIFERVVVWGMDHAHDMLNNLVVPHVVGFVVALPWRLLMVVFPALPPPTAPTSSRRRSPPTKANDKGGMAARLQHLKLPSNNDLSAGKRQPRSPPQIEGPPQLPARASRLPSEKAEFSSNSDERADVNSASVTSHGLLRGKDDREGVNDAQLPSSDPSEDANVDPKYASPTPVSPLPGLDVTPPPRKDGRVQLPGSSESSPEGSKPRRRSIGEMVRSAITGDFKIRVRDHLFDFNTASPPPPPTVSDTVSPDRGQKRSVEGDGDVQTASNHGEEHDIRAAETASTNEGEIATRRGKVDKNATVVFATTAGQRFPSLAAASERQQADQPSYGSPSKNITRRRPSEFSKVIAGSGEQKGARDAGGDAAAGGAGSNAVGTGVVRRRNLAAVRTVQAATQPNGVREDSRVGATAKGANSNSKPALPSRGGGVAGNCAVSNQRSAGSPESRAKRLAEWRRKRAEQFEIQERERTRRLRAAKTKNNGYPNAAVRGAVTLPNAVGAGDLGSGENGRPAAGIVRSRRFRHVERFRSEMARVAGSAEGAGEDGGLSAAGATLPSGSSTGTKRLS